MRRNRRCHTIQKPVLKNLLANLHKTYYFSCMQTITDIINRLDEIVQQCIKEKKRAGYFAALYKRMTIAVADGIKHSIFEDAARMERIDVNFATRYLDAYDAYYSGRPCSASWKFTFDCCANESLVVIQHLLLGVNTHINLDLAIAAAVTAPGTGINDLQKDFNKINGVIAGLADDVQESLSKVWFPMRWLTKIANGKQMAVLNFSIDKARDASWASALLLSAMNDGEQQAYIQQMDTTVKMIGSGIFSPGLWMKFLLKIIHFTEYNDVARTIRLINTTVV